MGINVERKAGPREVKHPRLLVHGVGVTVRNFEGVPGIATGRRSPLQNVRIRGNLVARGAVAPCPDEDHVEYSGVDVFIADG